MNALAKFVQQVAAMDLVYAPNDPQNMTRVINAARGVLQEEGKRQQAKRDATPHEGTAAPSNVREALAWALSFVRMPDGVNPEEFAGAYNAATRLRDEAGITLSFDERTLGQLRTALMVRGMACETAGLIEAFVLRLLEHLDAGAAHWHVQQKKAHD